MTLRTSWRKNPSCTFCDDAGNYMGTENLCPCGSQSTGLDWPVFADGEDAGQPVNQTAWPDHIADEDRVEHDLSGSRDGYQGAPVCIRTRDRKGADPSEWPHDLRVQQFPRVEVPR